MVQISEKTTSDLRDFVNRNSNKIDIQFSPLYYPPLDSKFRKNEKNGFGIAHYFLLAASLEETLIIGRAENVRRLLIFLHEELGDNLFTYTSDVSFHKPVLGHKFYLEFGPLKTQIPQILASVNQYVIKQASGDLISYSKRFKNPREFAADISKHVLRMGGPIQVKIWIYLRWMVRAYPDLGVFKHFNPRDLYIPLSTDVARVGVCLGLVKDLKNRTWGDVTRVTEYARTLFPDDPAKVDYPFYLVGRWLQGKELNTNTLLETLDKFEEFYRKTGLSIVLFKDTDGYTAECPLLPGCITQGDTEDEALINLAQAIENYKKVQETIGRQ